MEHSVGGGGTEGWGGGGGSDDRHPVDRSDLENQGLLLWIIGCDNVYYSFVIDLQGAACLKYGTYRNVMGLVQRRCLRWPCVVFKYERIFLYRCD